jgi:cytochrome c oxidase cbb3-type subunit I/II
MINAMRTLGVPYAEGYENQANNDVDAQAEKIVKNLKEAGIETTKDKEIVAMIAYLQRMGTDIKVKEEMAVK